MSVKNEKMILNVYTGPMFAGKTTRLITDFNNLVVDNELDKIAFKFSKDTRYEGEQDNNGDKLGRKMIYSHDKKHIPSIPITSCQEIIEKLKLITNEYNTYVKYIFIDEGQFFPKIKDWYDEIITLKNNSQHELYKYISAIKEISISGLDYDASGNVFNQQFYALSSYADYLLVAHSKCYKCGDNAFYTILLDKESQSKMVGNVLVGDDSIYQPACKQHINFSIKDE